MCFAVVFCCCVSTLACLIYAVNRKFCRVGQFDQLVYEIMELLDRYAGHLHLKRKRNDGKLSLAAKVPDLCIFVRDALFFKSQQKLGQASLMRP